MLRSRSCSFPYFKVQIYCSIIPQFLLFPVLEVSHLPGYGWFGKHVGIGMDIFIDLPGLNIYGEMWFWWSGRMIYRLAFQATIPCCIESIPGSIYFPESTGITALATLWNVSDLGLHNSAAKRREIVAIWQDTVKSFFLIPSHIYAGAYNELNTALKRAAFFCKQNTGTDTHIYISTYTHFFGQVTFFFLRH